MSSMVKNNYSYRTGSLVRIWRKILRMVVNPSTYRVITYDQNWVLCYLFLFFFPLMQLAILLNKTPISLRLVWVAGAVTNPFSQWVLSMTRTWTQDLLILSQLLQLLSYVHPAVQMVWYSKGDSSAPTCVMVVDTSAPTCLMVVDTCLFPWLWVVSLWCNLSLDCYYQDLEESLLPIHHIHLLFSITRYRPCY